ncbi:hypothetical protein RvY_14615 [Ramazzottius varieornatus]|uniref:Uncharacterized protein n=1 Tax=Ramazzottius varieornatus TaxID=947166 RepID=A0A1D1VZ61_RAMVA|nr:hypothetical protein RvY_14615 [Ramazzottius varieornatus]
MTTAGSFRQYEYKVHHLASRPASTCKMHHYDPFAQSAQHYNSTYLSTYLIQLTSGGAVADYWNNP